MLTQITIASGKLSRNKKHNRTTRSRCTLVTHIALLLSWANRNQSIVAIWQKWCLFYTPLWNGSPTWTKDALRYEEHPTTLDFIFLSRVCNKIVFLLKNYHLIFMPEQNSRTLW